MNLEGRLLSLFIEPGSPKLGITVLVSDERTPDGRVEGRYLARPESVYGTISFDGRSIPNLQELLDCVMGAKKVQVKLTYETGYDYFRIADFTGEK